METEHRFLINEELEKVKLDVENEKADIQVERNTECKEE